MELSFPQLFSRKIRLFRVRQAGGGKAQIYFKGGKAAQGPHASRVGLTTWPDCRAANEAHSVHLRNRTTTLKSSQQYCG
jgi:hypothetical protein